MEKLKFIREGLYNEFHPKFSDEEIDNATISLIKRKERYTKTYIVFKGVEVILRTTLDKEQRELNNRLHSLTLLGVKRKTTLYAGTVNATEVEVNSHFDSERASKLAYLATYIDSLSGITLPEDNLEIRESFLADFSSTYLDYIYEYCLYNFLSLIKCATENFDVF